jgi:hypothetical protein
LDNPTAPRAGPSQHGWNSGPNQRRSPHLGGGRSNLPDMHLRATIISVFEPMYLDILNNNMVGYANISAIDMLDHLFETYVNITAVDLEINFEHMRRDWDPQQPVESLFKQIQDCANYYEAGGGTRNKLTLGMQKYLQQVT